MVTHSSVLAWEILWTEELGGLQFIGSQRVRRNWAHTHMQLPKAMPPHSRTLAWKIPWAEEPGGLQSTVTKSRTGLSDFTFIFHFQALEKEMATHSSVLA